MGPECTFRSAPPHEERPDITIRFSKEAYVSIRAPARGATPGRIVILNLIGGFDPRPRARSDLAAAAGSSS
jgi:hypothetical protein